MCFSLSIHLHVYDFQKNSGLVGADVDKAREAVLKIQGNIVEMPLHFLEKENLAPNITHIINFAPDALFTWHYNYAMWYNFNYVGCP